MAEQSPTDMVEIYHPIIKKKSEVQRIALPHWIERGWVEQEETKPLPSPRPRVASFRQ